MGFLAVRFPFGIGLLSGDLFECPSKELHSDMSTGLSISQSMMMARQVVPAGCCRCLKLVVGKSAAEMPAGCGQGIVEDIVKIIHLINPVNGFQAAFIKAGIVRY